MKSRTKMYEKRSKSRSQQERVTEKSSQRGNGNKNRKQRKDGKIFFKNNEMNTIFIKKEREGIYQRNLSDID